VPRAEQDRKTARVRRCTGRSAEADLLDPHALVEQDVEACGNGWLEAMYGMIPTTQISVTRPPITALFP
jgi:hypothetical protein